MKKTLSFILSALMAFQITPALKASAEESKLLINEAFNSYATNLSPEDLDISGRGVYVRDIDGKNKGLNFSCRDAVKSITFNKISFSD